MLGEIVNNRAFEIHSLFDITNFFVFTQFGNKNADMEHVDSVRLKKNDTFLVYFVLLWTMLYFIYHRCLNSFLRQMRFPLVQRSRLIEAVWTCGFCFGSICYLMSLLYRPVSFPSLGWRSTFAGDLGNVLYKSFYLHRAGIVALGHGTWIKGWENVFFTLFIFNHTQQKWCSTISQFLLYNTIDAIISDVSRILLCLHHSVGRIIARVLFLVHCLSWSYIYLYFVTKRMLMSEETKNLKIDLALWSWFILSCLDSVWLKICRKFDFNHWIEVCLFPPPTQEAIELANIRKKHRESLKKTLNCRSPKKTELWQTLLCAMAVKKKIKKMKQAKENESVPQVDILEKEEPIVDSEEEAEEGDSESQTDSEETKETPLDEVDEKE